MECDDQDIDDVPAPHEMLNGTVDDLGSVISSEETAR